MAAVEYIASGAQTCGVGGVIVDAVVTVYCAFGVADKIKARCGQLTTQIGMVEQYTRVDDGNNHARIARSRFPSLRQFDHRIMPLLFKKFI